MTQCKRYVCFNIDSTSLIYYESKLDGAIYRDLLKLDEKILISKLLINYYLTCMELLVLMWEI
jgi:hypothetical protein